MMLQQAGIFRLLPRVFFEVFGRPELKRIDEDRRDHPIGFQLRRVDQRHMAGMESAHSRNQRNRLASVTPRQERRGQIA
jgi:hypothetical protein